MNQKNFGPIRDYREDVPLNEFGCRWPVTKYHHACMGVMKAWEDFCLSRTYPNYPAPSSGDWNLTPEAHIKKYELTPEMMEAIRACRGY